MHNWKRSHPCDVSAKGPIVAVRKGNQEGTDFGRECLMCKFHPETEGNGESCCPCQSWWALGVGQWSLSSYCIWLHSPCLNLQYVCQRTQVIIYPSCQGQRSWNSWGEHFAPTNDQILKPQVIDLVPLAPGQSALFLPFTVQPVQQWHSTKRKYIICHPTLICFFS